MRPVLHGDVVAAARALLLCRAEDRPGRIATYLMRAELADRYRKRIGRPHPGWGNGTLMDVAMREPQRPEPFLNDAEYLECLAQVIEALLARRVRG